MLRTRLSSSGAYWLLVALVLAPVGRARDGQAAPSLAPAASTPPGAAPRSAHEVAPKELFEIERVVDGDTLWIRRKGAVEKLRLLSVDTEERLGKGHTASDTKPQTVFGEETALWAQDVFAKLAKEGEKARVGLVFPGGREQRDVYGRLLCHVLLPDGSDYNLLLVRSGRSPYFDKYGRDELDHAAFARAEDEARKAELGIWSPKTNVAATPGEPSARRPYDRLIPWWRARAEAIESFRKRKAEKPELSFHAEDKDGLARAVAAGKEVEVFGEVGRTFDEQNGYLTVLLRGADAEHDVRVRIAADAKSAHASLDFAALGAEFRQNYVWVRGKLEAGGRGLQMRTDGAQRWTKAGPEPKFAATNAPAGAGAR
ncbi:MAG: thermonuclease family protein [Planctomycetes bacterium]|nr:thermonuclease family protein [Planctomycetota bacterium]